MDINEQVERFGINEFGQINVDECDAADPNDATCGDDDALAALATAAQAAVCQACTVTVEQRAYGVVVVLTGLVYAGSALADNVAAALPAWRLLSHGITCQARLEANGGWYAPRATMTAELLFSPRRS